MFTPKYPTPDTAPAPVVPLVPMPSSTVHPPACGCQRTPAVTTSAPVSAPVSRSAVQLTPGSLAVVIAGGAGVVLVVGAVLVSMLLAVAITGVSVALCAVVLRSLLRNHQGR
ncbi:MULTISPECIES: SpdD protein [unclassified Streptomyces]|uniref:SpdD protein n=1 Tax=unclassified Streptomyces TaxID=2593676 RepID=UPI002DD85F65|nr:SpdD protein [Streptomyces sp. NBC_01766]WSC22735.1 SpdD protein [Streptomyces sp. NBC_01766]